MDRLINYIEFRFKKYGGIKGISSKTSMYYHFGNIKVRVSDHMKYGEKELLEYDYFFTIQPNDMYIFSASPKYNEDKKLYQRIMTYGEAKDFIRTLHDHALQFLHATDWYHPSGWNGVYENDSSDPEIPERLNWDDFYNKYMSTKNDNKKLSIVHRIESIAYGHPEKGNLEQSIPIAIQAYNDMNSFQYNALMRKMVAEA